MNFKSIIKIEVLKKGLKSVGKFMIDQFLFGISQTFLQDFGLSKWRVS